MCMIDANSDSLRCLSDMMFVIRIFCRGDLEDLSMCVIVGVTVGSSSTLRSSVDFPLHSEVPVSFPKMVLAYQSSKVALALLFDLVGLIVLQVR